MDRFFPIGEKGSSLLQLLLITSDMAMLAQDAIICPTVFLCLLMGHEDNAMKNYFRLF